MFSKILIANRGEIAVRIIRACKEMGVATVAVYSEADRNALHVALADQSYCIGGPEASESYLNEQQIISAAVLAGAQAIHPGYGFLSENAHFARLCQKNGLAFIGPDPEHMEKLSDKAVLKELIQTTGLTPIPGTKALTGVEEAKTAAQKIGYPVMLKACAGGGGRGIRLIRTEEELEQAWYQATSEALSAFGDGSVYLEKYVSPARHVELQMLADEQGNVVCLGERDCSLQRRNQKLIEETPSPAVSPEQRQNMIALAVDAVGSVSGTAAEHDCPGGGCGEENRLCGSRYSGISSGPAGQLLVHGDERPAAGGALRHRDAHRYRSGEMADPDCRRNSFELYPGEHSHDRIRHRVPDQRHQLRHAGDAPCPRRALGAL